MERFEQNTNNQPEDASRYEALQRLERETILRNSNMIQWELAQIFFPDPESPATSFFKWTEDTDNHARQYRNLLDTNPEIKRKVEKGDMSVVQEITDKLSH